MEDKSKSAQLLDTGAFEAETLRRAREGGRAENMDALELAVSGLFSGSLSYSLALYLAQGLEEAMQRKGGLSGASFVRAFKLSRLKKGHPAQEETAGRNSQLAVWVHLAERRGLSPADAKGKAEDLFNVANAARCLREAGPVSEVDEEACEGWLARAGKPLPPRQ